jgi:uncharacterized protein RhaS with RHS repeats
MTPLTNEWTSLVSGYNTTYTYDPVGNRTSKLEGGLLPQTTQYSYDAANQLTTLTNPYNEIISLTYDRLRREIPFQVQK